MAEEKRYPTERMKCWEEAKSLRNKYYEDYYRAHERGGLCVTGSATMYYSILAGLGDDVYALTGEPYAATVAVFPEFSAKCMESVERSGVARDLCAYLRNYWGSIMLNKFVLPDGTILDGWPKPDFLFTGHACCTHAKWYQRAGELEGGAPYYALDLCCHPLVPSWNENQLNYIVQQLAEFIPWAEKVTGRKFNDEKFIEAIHNECESSRLFGEICMYQRNIPAPMDEKTMFSFYVFESLAPHRKEIVEFYRRLRDEVQDRVERGIASYPVERYRVVTGGAQPPWAFLQIWRYLQREYGVISVGSLYTFGLQTEWEEDEQGNFIPAKTPKEKGLRITNREEALRAYAEFKLKNWVLAGLFSLDFAPMIIKKMVQQWHVDAVILHFNRGCEGSTSGATEMRLALVEEDIPVLTYEGSMADYRDFDLPRTMARVDAFLEGVGLKKLTTKA